MKELETSTNINIETTDTTLEHTAPGAFQPEKKIYPSAIPESLFEYDENDDIQLVSNNYYGECGIFVADGVDCWPIVFTREEDIIFKYESDGNIIAIEED